MSKGFQFRACLLVLLLVLAIGTEAFASDKRVLIVYSYDAELDWTQQCDRGIRQALPDSVSIERVYMDTKRIPQDEFENQALKVLDEFRRIKPDLVMVSDDNALRLVGPEIAATNVPVVYLGINGNPRDYFEYLPPNVTGVIERIPLFHWIRGVCDIVPTADSLLVLMDSSPTADAIIASSFQGRSKMDFDNKEVGWFKAKDWSSWQQTVLDQDYDIIIMPIYHALKRNDGEHVPINEVISWTAANSRVPVFATQDYAVGKQGVVGGFVIVGEEHGRLAGLIANGILEGIPIKHLSTADDQLGAYYFSKSQLKRFGLVLPRPIREKANYKE